MRCQNEVYLNFSPSPFDLEPWNYIVYEERNLIQHKVVILQKELKFFGKPQIYVIPFLPELYFTAQILMGGNPFISPNLAITCFISLL